MGDEGRRGLGLEFIEGIVVVYLFLGSGRGVGRGVGGGAGSSGSCGEVAGRGSSGVGGVERAVGGGRWRICGVARGLS